MSLSRLFSWGTGGTTAETLDRSAYPVVAGLSNVGNSCFLNSTLQGLAATEAFVTFIRAHASGQTDPATINNKHPKPITPLTDTLKELIDEINANNQRVITPYALLKRLRKTTHLFETTAQQDAHELLQIVLSFIDSEDKKLYDSALFQPGLKDVLDGLLSIRPHPDVVTPAAVTQLTRAPLIPARISRPDLHRNPFVGWFSSTHACLECGSLADVRCSLFNNISVAIPHSFRPRVVSRGQPTPSAFLTERVPDLLDCLVEFTKWEYIDGVECVRCTRRVKGEDFDVHAPGAKLCKTRVRKRVWIGRPPKALSIHVKRLIGHGTTLQKLSVRVSFPLVLDISPFFEMPKIVQTAQRTAPTSQSRCGEVVVSPQALKSQGEKAALVGTTDQNAHPRRRLARTNTVSSIEPPSVSILGTSVGEPSRATDLLTERAGVNALPRLTPRHSHEHTGDLPSLYHLCAVVAHLGSANSGHFVTYRRPPPECNAAPNIWLATSDAVVSIVHEEEVLNAQAYMLFYEMKPEE